MLCVAKAQEQGAVFTHFSLQMDKWIYKDTQVATGHISDRMIQQVYDRRIVKRARTVR